MLGLAARCVVQAMPSEESPQAAQASVSLRSLVTGTCKDVHKYVESVVGTNVIESTVEVRRIGKYAIKCIMLPNS